MHRRRHRAEQIPPAGPPWLAPPAPRFPADRQLYSRLVEIPCRRATTETWPPSASTSANQRRLLLTGVHCRRRSTITSPSTPRTPSGLSRRTKLPSARSSRPHAAGRFRPDAYFRPTFRPLQIRRDHHEIMKRPRQPVEFPDHQHVTGGAAFQGFRQPLDRSGRPKPCPRGLSRTPPPAARRVAGQGIDRPSRRGHSRSSWSSRPSFEQLERHQLQLP